MRTDESEPGGKWKDVSREKWNDWRWQMQNCLTTLEELKQVIQLTPEEEEGIIRSDGRLTMAITPYFASLIDPVNPRCPLRLQVIPHVKEFALSSHDLTDPLGEDSHSPTPNLVHRYPDRVLLLVQNMCASYCRYCTRKRWVGTGQPMITDEQLEMACEYLAKHKKIRDVLLSGGDPLMMSDAKLEKIIKRLREIPNIEIVRIGTRVPIFVPQRVTPELVAMLRKYHPFYMSLHFNHAKEVAPDVAKACMMLADGGIPLGSQTVLLKGVNDRPEVLKKLFHELLKIRVRPYYLFQCDLVVGSEHLRTTVDKGIEIIEKLRGHTTGYAVPTYVVDLPGGGGKIPVQPEYAVAKGDGKWVFRNYEGKTFEYYDPFSEGKKVKTQNGRTSKNGRTAKVVGL